MDKEKIPCYTEMVTKLLRYNMKKHKLIILVLILALGVFLRFFRLNEVPLGLYPDEAMNGNNALEAQAMRDYKVFYPENNGREGFFINLQSIALMIFGREPWALRSVSALAGTLTIFGVFLVTKELFSQRGNKRKRSASTTIALLAAFFVATSFWHINFSRIGFRAIMFPLLTSFALYFLLKGLRTKKIPWLIAAGIATGMGLQTYIAFRFFPFVAAIPLIAELWRYFRGFAFHKKIDNAALDSKASNNGIKNKKWIISCSPCAVILYLFVTFVVALPIGVYFLNHPQDFVGRSAQVSIFSTSSPLQTFIDSNIKIVGMFFVKGDCNWRHNYNCEPQLVWPVAFFFAIGLLMTIRDLFKRAYERSSASILLLTWLGIMSLPATLTWEGLPHALRSIGMIPPLMMLAALGYWRLIRSILDWFERRKFRFPERLPQLARIQKEMKALFMVMVLIIPIYTYRSYFISWAHSPYTYFAFATDMYHMGEYLRDKPADVTAYVIVNLAGIDVRGIPMPSQTVMFVTDTFQESERTAKHIIYLRSGQLDLISVKVDQKVTILALDGADRGLLAAIRKRFPALKPHSPSDFTVWENF